MSKHNRTITLRATASVLKGKQQVETVLSVETKLKLSEFETQMDWKSNWKKVTSNMFIFFTKARKHVFTQRLMKDVFFFYFGGLRKQNKQFCVAENIFFSTFLHRQLSHNPSDLQLVWQW